MRPAAFNPAPCKPLPVIISAVRGPLRSKAAACSTFAPDGSGACGTKGFGATTPPSLHETSVGTIRVAMRPGSLPAAAIASDASRPSPAVVRDVRSQAEYGRAIPSTSEVSAASYRRCVAGCWPIMLTIGVRALLALCRFAMPLAKPGPRCSSVHAGFPAIRAYPSAAPVTTPSNKPSTQRISGARSGAATMCISDVPGLVKQAFTPPASSVRIRLSAPFMNVFSRNYLGVEGFIEVPRNHCAELVRMFRDHSKMVARNSFAVEFLEQAGPDCNGVCREIREHGGPHEPYFSGIVTRAVTPDRFAGHFRGVAHCRRHRCGRRGSLRRFRGAASRRHLRAQLFRRGRFLALRGHTDRRTHFSQCQPAIKQEMLPRRKQAAIRISIQHSQQRDALAGGRKALRDFHADQAAKRIADKKIRAMWLPRLNRIEMVLRHFFNGGERLVDSVNSACLHSIDVAIAADVRQQTVKIDHAAAQTVRDENRRLGRTFTKQDERRKPRNTRLFQFGGKRSNGRRVV